MLGTIVINKQKSNCYGNIRFFKNKGKDTQKELTLEDCIIKMFASADIEPHREGDEFSFKVQGKYCVFNVTLSYEANRIIVCIPFPIPVNRKVAKSSMYEVKRIDSFVQKETLSIPLFVK